MQQASENARLRPLGHSPTCLVTPFAHLLALPIRPPTHLESGRGAGGSKMTSQGVVDVEMGWMGCWRVQTNSLCSFGEREGGGVYITSGSVLVHSHSCQLD